MNFFKIIIFASIFLIGYKAKSQTTNGKDDVQQISEALTDYIEGTANGDPDRVKKAFHPDFNLYSVRSDTLYVWDGTDYIDKIKKGVKNNRQGRIISIDHEKDAAIAKVQIVIPNERIFTDYFLLLKYQGSWKIVHKSFTSRAYNN